MAGKGSKTTSGISTSKSLYGWDSIYDSSNYIVRAKSGQTEIYASPYWYQQIYGTGNNTFYAGGFYSGDISKYPSGLNLSAYTATSINGGTGSNWVSFSRFTDLSQAITYKNRTLVPLEKIKNEPLTSGNDFSDLGATNEDEDGYYLPSSLITGTGSAVGIYGTPGVVVNLSDQSLGNVLNPLIRPVGASNEFGLSSGLSDYLSARLLESQAVWGGDVENSLYGKYEIPSLQTLTGGLAARSYAFFTREEGSANYAVGQVVNIQNAQGSNDASNLLVGGRANGILQGGWLADIIIGGSGNSTMYGMGGNDLLISTSGNDTLYAGQFGRIGKTTPKAAIVSSDAPLRDGRDLGNLGTDNATTFVAGTGVVTMVGSDVGNDYFIIGSSNNTVYGSGLGASGLGPSGTSINAPDFDTLSLNQIGTTYYKNFKNLTVTVAFTDTYRESGTVVGTYEKAGGSIATLLNTRFFDIEKIIFGSTLTLFRDPNGFFYPDDPLEPGYTGGDPGVVNNQTGLIDPGPATTTVTGLNPAGGNVINGGGGGNTNFNGGGGPNPNTLNFNSTSGGTFYPCEDQSGGVGNVRNFSLVLHLGNERYSYQQNIDGTPKVFGGTVANFQNVTGTVCCSDIIAGTLDTISLTGGGGIHNILFGGGKGQAAPSQLMVATLFAASAQTATELKASHTSTDANYGRGYNWVVFQDPTDLLGGIDSANGSGKGQTAYRSGLSGVVADLSAETYSFFLDSDPYAGRIYGFANVLGTAGNDELTGNSARNVLVGGDGNDTINGGGGDDGPGGYGGDILFGGAGINLITGSSSGKETFVVGYDFNSLAASAYTDAGNYDVDLSTPAMSTSANPGGERSIKIGGDGNTVQIITTSDTATDYISGWNTGTTDLDSLYISSSGTAIILGFSDDDSHLTLDFSAAQNLGLISVVVGNGNNTIYGSTSAYRDVSGRDGGTDSIKAGNGNNTISSGDGDDIVIVGNGNNIITVGEGAGKKIYTGGGSNTITLGAGDDTVYISRLTTKNDIKGFTTGVDKIKLDVSMLNAYGIMDLDQKQIDPTDPLYAPRIILPQDYKSGVFIGAPLFDVTYRARVDDSYNNGAAGNTDHYASYVAGITSTTALQIGLFATAYALWGIPIVGPIIGSIIVGLGLGVIADQVLARQHLNPVYNTNANDVTNDVDDYDSELSDGRQTDNPIWGLSNVMFTNDISDAASGSGWANTPFMSFYEYSTAGGFIPSLEVIADYNEGDLGVNKQWVNQSSSTTSTLPEGQIVRVPGVDGIRTVALLHSGSGESAQTFIYLINSGDALIQSNETKLIARVNGHIKATDIDWFDAKLDDNLGRPTPSFSPPPDITTFEFTAAAEKNLTAIGSFAVTNGSDVELKVNFSGPLRLTDIVSLTTATGTQIGAAITNSTASFITFSLTGLAEGGNGYIVTVGSEDGLDKTSSFVVAVDTVAPTNTMDQNPVGVNASSIGIEVSANEPAKFGLYSGGVLIELDTSAVLPSQSSVDADGLVPLSTLSFRATVVPIAQDEFTWLDSARFTDLGGNTSTVNFGTQPDGIYQLPYIGLGTIGNDVVDVAADIVVADKNKNNVVVYGFGGEDSVKASSSITSATTFIGGLSANVITADANGGNLIVDLSSSVGQVDSVVVVNGSTALRTPTDADASVALTVTGFTANEDTLNFSGVSPIVLGVSGDQHIGTYSVTVSNGLVTFTGTTLPTSLDEFIGAIQTIMADSSAGTTLAFKYEYETKVYSNSGSETDSNGLLYDLAGITDLYLVYANIGSPTFDQFTVLNLAGVDGSLSGIELIGVDTIMMTLGT